jgi:hypothetical protein
MADKYPINLWVNEERYWKLEKAGLAVQKQRIDVMVDFLKNY